MTRSRLQAAFFILTTLTAIALPLFQTAGASSTTLIHETWDGGLSGWTVTNDGASVDCSSDCALRMAPPCCSNAAIVSRDLTGAFDVPVVVSFDFMPDVSYGDTDTGIQVLFDTETVALEMTGGYNDGILLEDSLGQSTPDFATTTAGAWNHVRLVLDPVNQTAIGQLLDDTGAVVATSEALPLAASPTALSSFNINAVTWSDPTMTAFTYDNVDVTMGDAPATTPVDNDGDGYASNVDCNDSDASINPGAYDVPDDGIDQNCDGVDATSYADNDGDGYTAANDCNDSDWSIHPDAWDTPYDGIDQDCNGVDSTLDGFQGYFQVSIGDGRDDATYGVQPDATEGYDAAYDAPQPPAAPANDTVEAYFEYPGNAPDQQHLSTSFVPGNATVAFPLRVTWSMPDTCVSCYTPNGAIYAYFSAAMLPKEFNAYLVDGATIYNLRDYNDGYGIPLTVDGNAGQRNFTVLLTSEQVQYVYLNYGWSLVSIPVQASDMSVDGIFHGAADAVYSWDGAQYQPVSGDLQPGVGYWVHATSWNAIPVLGVPVRSLDLTLQPGWNLVGAPATGGVLWNAPEGVSHTAFYWGYNGYYSTSYIWPGYGAWVYVDGSPASIHLGDASVRAPSLVQPLSSSSGSSDGPSFALPFVAKDESGAHDGATLAMRSGASDGYDSLDVMEPPTPAASTWTSAAFQAQGKVVDRDAVAPAQKGAYTLVVTRDAPAGQETLSWNATMLAKGYTFELVDGSTRVDLREASSYSWSAGDGLSAKTFQVVVRPESAPLCLLSLDGACGVELPFDPASLL